MRFINSLADRLLEKVAPTVTADAACIYLNTEYYVTGQCKGNPMAARIRTTVNYDNCRSKVTYNCS